jgi:hypothetical protein
VAAKAEAQNIEALRCELVCQPHEHAAFVHVGRDAVGLNDRAARRRGLRGVEGAREFDAIQGGEREFLDVWPGRIVLIRTGIVLMTARLAR